VTIGPINATGETATLSYLTNVNPISCNVILGPITGAGTPDPTNVTLNSSGTAMSTTDSSAGACDIYPDVIPIGVSTQMTNVPYLDLRFIQGNASSNVPSTNKNAVIWNESGTNKYWPIMRIVGPSGTDNQTIIYDSESGSDGLLGLKVYDKMNARFDDNGETINNAQNATYFNTTTVTNLLINQPVTSTSATESTKYDITPWSTELDGSVTGQLTAIVPETRRDAIVEISQTIGNGTSATGTVTATEGQTVGNVKVMSIGGNCPVSGTNLFSPTKVVAPESLVVLDSEASATYQIVVGGPWVNSVAQTVSGNEATTTAAGASVLIADGTKLLVAGYLATDTASAADALVNKLKA